MAQEKSGSGAGAALLYFAAGAALGAGAALLSTPKTGRQMRENLSDLTDDAVARIKVYANQAQSKYNALLEEGRAQIGHKPPVEACAIEEGRKERQWEQEQRELRSDISRSL